MTKQDLDNALTKIRRRGKFFSRILSTALAADSSGMPGLELDPEEIRHFYHKFCDTAFSSRKAEKKKNLAEFADFCLDRSITLGMLRLRGQDFADCLEEVCERAGLSGAEKKELEKKLVSMQKGEFALELERAFSASLEARVGVADEMLPTLARSTDVIYKGSANIAGAKSRNEVLATALTWAVSAVPPITGGMAFLADADVENLLLASAYSFDIDQSVARRFSILDSMMGESLLRGEGRLLQFPDALKEIAHFPEVRGYFLGRRQTRPLRSVALLPMISFGRRLGMLVFVSEKERILDCDFERLTLIGSIVTMALSRLLLHDEVSVRMSDLNGIYRLVRLCRQGLGLKQNLELMMPEAVRLLSADLGMVFTWDEDRGMGRLEYSYGVGAEAMTAYDSVPVRIPVLYRVSMEREEYRVFDDLLNDPLTEGVGLPPELEGRDGKQIQSLALFSLVSGERDLGIMVMGWNRTGAPDERVSLLLRYISGLVADEVKSEMALRVIQSELSSRSSEIKLAKQIQLGFVPTLTHFGDWWISTRIETAGEPAGDFAVIRPTPRDEMILGVGDVSGKGLGASLMMMSAHSLIHQHALGCRGLEALVDRVNKELRLKFAELGDSLFSSGFVTSVLLSIKPNTGRVEFVNSGHLLPLVYRSRTGRIQELKGEGIPLGIFDEITVEKRHVNLAPGDRLLLFTDGIFRADNLFKEIFGEKQLKEAIRKNALRFPAELADEIFKALKGFIQGRVLKDDITMLVLGRADENWDEVVIPSKLKSGYKLAEALPQQLVKRFDFQEGFHLQVALAEALTNAVVHGNKSDPAKKVRMRSRVERGCLHIEIQDEGSGFNPEKLNSPLDSQNLMLEGGRGIFLMRCFCDNVYYEEPGNTVHMIKQVIHVD